MEEITRKGKGVKGIFNVERELLGGRKAGFGILSISDILLLTLS